MTASPPDERSRRRATMSVGPAPALIVAIPTGVALLAALRVPFTASPGAAGAQLLAVVGGLSLAFATTVRASRRDTRGFRADALWSAGAAMLATAVWSLASLVSEALRPACGASKGLAPFLVLAVPVLLLQGAVGAWIGRLTGTTWRALLGVFAFEALAILSLVIGFYLDPAWRIVSHLFVALNTEQVWGSAAPEGVDTYRAATLCFALALAAFGVAVFPGTTGDRRRRPRRAWLMGALLLAIGLVVDRNARHTVAPTHDDLARAYVMTKTRGPLVLHADPLVVRPADLDVMLAEGTLWLDRIAARLGQRPQQPIHVWVHASSEEKQRWTGASRADFALPWRHEIHVRLGGAEHHTLGHELVHVIAGEPLTTLFRTPSVGMVLQRMALIEGLAVAITPELKHSDALTVREEVAALTRLNRVADPQRLFDGLAFLSEAHQGAYAAAGSVLGAVDEQAHDGGATLRAVYAAGTLAGGLKSAERAEQFYRGYRAQLDSMTLPDGARTEVNDAFAEPSVVTATCRVAPEDRARAVRVLARTGGIREALALAGDSGTATLRDLEAELRAVGDTADFPVLASAYSARVDTSALSTPLRFLSAGDLLWQADSVAAARAIWARIPLTLSPPGLARAAMARQRLADAVLGATRDTMLARAALGMLLHGFSAGSAVDALAVARALDAADARAASAPASDAGEARTVRSLARYLLARRQSLFGRPDAAAPLLEQVLREHALPALFLEEATLMRARALATIGRAADAVGLLTTTPTAGARRVFALDVADLAERARRAALAPPRPRTVTMTSDPAWADRMLLTPFEP